MVTMVQTSLLRQVLRLMPARVITMLDAWSYRVARKHAERRRLAASGQKTGPWAAIHYKLKLWRD
jgi:hypothetical protein